jgi:hypothetical protein
VPVDTLPASVLWTDADTDQLRELVQDEDARQWQIGDLLLERLPWGEPGKSTGVMEALRDVAASVGAEPAILKQYRQVARSWPKDLRRPFATWTAHKALQGHPESAAYRADLLDGLTRNEHGYVTVKAVRDLTKGATHRPGWFELLGEVGDTLVKARKQLEKFEAAVGDDEFHEDLGAKAREYAQWADDLASRLREFDAA